MTSDDGLVEKCAQTGQSFGDGPCTWMSAKILGGIYASARSGGSHDDSLGLLLHSADVRVGPDRRLSLRIRVLSSRLVPSRLGIDDPRSLRSVLLWRILPSSGLRALSGRRRLGPGTSPALFATRMVVVVRCALIAALSWARLACVDPLMQRKALAWGAH